MKRSTYRREAPASEMLANQERWRSVVPRCASLVAIMAIGLLAACTRHQPPAQSLSKRGVAPPEETRFVICHGFGCTFRTEVTFTEAE